MMLRRAFSTRALNNLPLLPLRRIPLRLPPKSSSPFQPVSRSVHSSTTRFAKYDRFPSSSPGWEPPPPGTRGRGLYGHPIVQLLKRRLGGDRGLLIFSVGGGGCVVYYLAHLERVPETGRLRFIDVSPSTEAAISLQTQQETLSQYQGRLLSPNSMVARRVREVAKRIVESNGLGHIKEEGLGAGIKTLFQGGEGRGSSGIGEMMFGHSTGGGVEWDSGEVIQQGKDVEWEVFVIKDDETKNAFVLPGGKIFVFTGILPVCANDDGLASVLGHEVAHQVARHGAERLSSAKVLFALGYGLEILGLDVGISRLLLTFLLQLPNSRKSESEADYIGVRLMSKACFDPRESTRMWTRMSQSEKTGSGGGSASIDFLSTHPANQKRIASLEKWMPEALEIRAASSCGDTTSQYEMFKEHIPTGGNGRVWR